MSDSEFSLDEFFAKGLAKKSAAQLDAWASASWNKPEVLEVIASAPNLGTVLLKDLLKSDQPLVVISCLKNPKNKLTEEQLLELVKNQQDPAVYYYLFRRITSEKVWAAVRSRPDLASPLMFAWPAGINIETEVWVINQVLTNTPNSSDWVKLSTCFGNIPPEAVKQIDLELLADRVLNSQTKDTLAYLLNGSEIWPGMPELLTSKTEHASLEVRKEVAFLYNRGQNSPQVEAYLQRVEDDEAVLEVQSVDPDQVPLSMLPTVDAHTTVEQISDLMRGLNDRDSAWDALAANPNLPSDWPFETGWKVAVVTATVPKYASVYAIRFLQNPDILEGFLSNLDVPVPNLSDYYPMRQAVAALLSTASWVNPTAFDITPEQFTKDWKLLLARLAFLVSVKQIPPVTVDRCLHGSWVTEHPQDVPIILADTMGESTASQWLSQRLLELSKTLGPNVIPTAREYVANMQPDTTSADVADRVEAALKVYHDVNLPKGKTRRPRTRRPT